MRNPKALHVDFRDLIGVMGKILPSNVDMIVERNGYFLVGEWKRAGEDLSIGQSILLKQLAKIDDKFVVLIIQGHTDEGVMVIDKFWRMGNDGIIRALGDTVEKFKKFLVHWKNGVEKL